MKKIIVAIVLAIMGGVGHIIKVVVFDVPQVKADVTLVKERTDNQEKILMMIHEDVKYIKNHMER